MKKSCEHFLTELMAGNWSMFSICFRLFLKHYFIFYLYLWKKENQQSGDAHRYKIPSDVRSRKVTAWLLLNVSIKPICICCISWMLGSGDKTATVSVIWLQAQITNASFFVSESCNSLKEYLMKIWVCLLLSSLGYLYPTWPPSL